VRRRTTLALVVAMSVVWAGAAATPQQDYVTHCMGCHGPTGAGVPGKIPPLRETLPAFARTSEGRAFLLSVPGASNSSLTDAELAAVVNFLLERYWADTGAGERHVFTTDEVARLRRPPLSQVRQARTAVLRSLAGTGPVPREDY